MKENQLRLLEIARESVQRTGLKALSFRTLGNEAGIKSSSVHYYFPEKSDLARELITHYRQALMDNLQQLSRDDESLKRQFCAFADMFDAESRSNRICLCCMMAAEFSLLNVENQALLAQVFDEMERWLALTIEGHRGEVASALDSSILAKQAVSGLEGALLVDRVMGNSDRLEAQKAILLSWLH